MSWHFIERWMQKVNQHSTLIGKFWITFLIVFRIVVVSSVGDRVYSDEQSEFKCNTAQVGCSNVCYNNFSPISHIRFWSFQIIMVSIPSIMFMVYSAHNTKKKGGKEKSPSSNSPVTPEKVRKPELTLAGAVTQWKGCPSDEDNSKKKNKQKNAMVPGSPQKKSKKKEANDEKPGFTEHKFLYVASVILRTIIEVFFILLQYYLFGLHIPSLYKCEGDPCPNKIDCFVSRPMEKNIFLWFMLIISIISFVLNILEIYHLAVKLLKRRYKHSKDRRELRATDFTIHDAETGPGGVIIPQYANPPDYGRINNNEFIPDPSLRGFNFKNEQKPLAISVSYDDAMMAEHLNGQPNSKLLSPTAPIAGNFHLSTTSIDQPYANLRRPDLKSGKNAKKGNEAYI